MAKYGYATEWVVHLVDNFCKPCESWTRSLHTKLATYPRTNFYYNGRDTFLTPFFGISQNASRRMGCESGSMGP